MAPDETTDSLERSMSIHIFSVSAAMVGVCLTVIGIIRVVIATRGASTLADDLLAFDSLWFLASCLLAYASMRARLRRRAVARRLEDAADVVFIIALLLMVAACVIITYALI